MPEPTLDLDAIRQRCEAATPEPLAHEWAILQGAWDVTPEENAANAHFMAHARQDIPDLLAAVARLTAERDRLRGALRPFAYFARQWNRKPISGLADTIYAIHRGTEYEASLFRSDCEYARQAMEPTP